MDGQRFDAISRALARRSSRRNMVRGSVGVGIGAVVAAIGWHASGTLAANDACARFCQQLPPGPTRGGCVAAAAHGQGACYECGPGTSDATMTLCGDSCVQLGTDTACSGCGDVCTGTGVTCGGGGVPGECGCTPEPQDVTCAGQAGTVTNNCGQPVECGCLMDFHIGCSTDTECCSGVCCQPDGAPYAICCSADHPICAEALECFADGTCQTIPACGLP